MAPRVRFAPSPTGMFHVGSARTALFNWLFARHHDGTFLLRIEDTDEARNHPQWTEGIVSAMTWMGLDWDGEAVFQSERAARHTEAAARLHAAGRAYYCDCGPESRRARAGLAADAKVPVPPYDRHCRGRELGPGPGRALRFRVPEGRTIVHDLVRGQPEFDNRTIEDFVILKANGGAIFYLANTVDDLDMGITHVIRGEEHLPNAPKGLLLWEALADGAPAPVFAHLPLLVNEHRQKLSKRRDKVALESFRDEGYLMEAMRNYLCLLGWSPGGDREFLTIDEMVAEFRLEQVVNSPAFFDVKKLTAFNEHYVQLLDDRDFLGVCRPFLAAQPWYGDGFDEATFLRMAPVVRERTKVLNEVPAMVDFLFVAEAPIELESWQKGVVNLQGGPATLADCLETYRDCPWEAAVLGERTLAIGQAHGLPRKRASAPVRVAVTGRMIGPPLFESLEVLGRDRTVARLAAAVNRLDD